MQTIKMGLRNILKNWRHSTGSILSVAIGFSALTLFNGYISVVGELYEDNYRYRSMFGDVFIEKTKNGDPIDFEDSRINPQEQIFLNDFFSRSGMVNAHVPILIVSGLANNGKTSSIFWGFAYDVEKGLQMRMPSWPWNVRAGKPLDTLSSEHVMLGESIAETFGCSTQSNEQILTQVGGYEARERPLTCDREKIQLNVTTMAGQVNATNVKIGALGGVGLRGIDSWYLMMDLNRAQQLFDTPDISHIRLRLKDPALFPEFIDSFKNAVSQAGLEIRAFDWREHILARVYKRTMSLFETFRNLVSLVILSISGMSVLNAMVKSVNERRREIGTLRSLGFFRKDIRVIFTTEGLLIGFAGSLLGSIFSILFSIAVNKIKFIYYAGFLTDPVPFLIGLNPSLYLISLLVLCTVAGLAAFFASNRTVKQPIPQLLTSV
jgi:putative ABC transport system permease protein